MLANIIVGLGFAGIVLFAFSKVRKDVKNNKCSCGSSCGSSCPSKGKCGKK